ncbi:MAG: DUF2116 family Zn-ribbon domain-containing protein [Chloroflexota bacterium]
MPDKISDHRHCPACGKPMGASNRFCSEECERGTLGQKKRQQRTMWIFMGVLIAFMALLYLGQGAQGCLGGT